MLRGQNQSQSEVGPPQRIRFSYDSLSQAQGKGAAFKLRPGDVLIVE